MTDPLCTWRPSPATIFLATNEAHVWRAALNLAPSAVERLAQTLDTDERAQAERFRFAADRDRYIAAHGLLRAILSRYVNASPAALQFERKANGKPVLAGGVDRSDLRFNMSHSHDLALYAVSIGREVGVDVERESDEVDMLLITERFFLSAEHGALVALPETARRAAFFRAWTRKEALLKATGGGLVQLEQLDASFLAPQAASHVTIEFGARRWTFSDLPVIEGYSAAIALEGGNFDLRCWQWA